MIQVSKISFNPIFPSRGNTVTATFAIPPGVDITSIHLDVGGVFSVDVPHGAAPGPIPPVSNSLDLSAYKIYPKFYNFLMSLSGLVAADVPKLMALWQKTGGIITSTMLSGVNPKLSIVGSVPAPAATPIQSTPLTSTSIQFTIPNDFSDRRPIVTVFAGRDLIAVSLLPVLLQMFPKPPSTVDCIALDINEQGQEYGKGMGNIPYTMSNPIKTKMVPPLGVILSFVEFFYNHTPSGIGIPFPDFGPGFWMKNSYAWTGPMYPAGDPWPGSGGYWLCDDYASFLYGVASYYMPGVTLATVWSPGHAYNVALAYEDKVKRIIDVYLIDPDLMGGKVIPYRDSQADVYKHPVFIQF